MQTVMGAATRDLTVTGDWTCSGVYIDLFTQQNNLLETLVLYGKEVEYLHDRLGEILELWERLERDIPLGNTDNTTDEIEAV